MDEIPFELFEKAVMDKILFGEDSNLAILREQYKDASVIEREFTGVGFYSTFQTSPKSPRLEIKHSIQLCGVIGQIDELPHGVGFVLFIKGGVIDCLEGFTYGDVKWPEYFAKFSLSYVDGEIRNMEYLKAKVRAKVEHPFHVVKNRFQHRKTRYRGLAKNTAQMFSLFGLANLLLAKRYLMPITG